MQAEIDRFFETQGRKWALSTADKYRWCLEDFAGWLIQEKLPGDPREITTAHISRYLDSKLSWSANMQYIAIVSLRNFFRWKLGRDGSPAEEIRYPKRHRKPQRTLDEPRIMQILSVLDTATAKGIRDTAIVLLMLDSGLRASEVCNLQRYHVDLENRTFLAQIKGGRWSDGVFGMYCASTLSQWMDIRPQIAKPEEPALFVGIGGIKPGTALTRNGLKSIFLQIGQKAGVHFSPHDMRRTFATMAIRAGAPSRLVQVAGRWNDLAMVERYSQAIRPQDMDPYSPVNKLMGLRFNEDDY